MLVLTRNKNEEIVICVGDEEIRIGVLSEHKKVRLGISAAEGISVDRKEVYLRKKQEEAEKHEKKGFFKKVKYAA